MVSKFVEISRAHNQKDDFSENEYNRIKTIYDNCLSSIIKNFDAEFIPSLIICNTYNKYSTVLPVKMKQNKYKYYVLYDRYLNELTGCLMQFILMKMMQVMTYGNYLMNYLQRMLCLKMMKSY